MKTTTGYSLVQILLHWGIALLIGVAWLTGEGAGKALDAAKAGTVPGFVPHVALGLAILALVVVRVVVRLQRGAPSAPGVPGSLRVLAAEWGHRLLYLLMIAVPLGGIATWFLGMDTGEIHELFGNALFFLAAAHAAVAVFHQVVLKDGLIRRMMRPA